MSENKKLTPVAIIYLDGNRLSPDWEGRVNSFRITDKLNSIGSCFIHFTCHNPEVDTDTETFPTGSNISILLGYKDDMHEVFNGQIKASGDSLSESGTSYFTIEASSYLQPLESNVNHHRCFEDLTHSEIVEKIFSEHGFEVDCDSFGTVTERLSQNTFTDLQFILLLTNRYGMNIYCFGKKVYIKQQITIHKGEYIYEWGKNLITFDATMGAKQQTVSVKVVGWDQLQKESFSGECGLSDVKVKVGGTNDWRSLSSGDAGENNIHTIVDNDVVDSAEAEEIAEARMREESFKFLQGKGKTEGDAKLAAGAVATIKGANIYNGEYIATEVGHDFSFDNGYVTTFSLERNMISDETVAALKP